MLPAERTIKRRCSSSKQSWSIAADHDVGLPRAGLALVTAIAIARRRLHLGAGDRFRGDRAIEFWIVCLVFWRKDTNTLQPKGQWNWIASDQERDQITVQADTCHSRPVAAPRRCVVAAPCRFDGVPVFNGKCGFDQRVGATHAAVENADRNIG